LCGEDAKLKIVQIPYQPIPFLIKSKTCQKLSAANEANKEKPRKK
jgi:hypothetical protein